MHVDLGLKENRGFRRSSVLLLRPLLPNLAPLSGVMAHVVVGGATWDKRRLMQHFHLVSWFDRTMIYPCLTGH